MERPGHRPSGSTGAPAERIVLASSSGSRRALLEAAGVPFDVDPALVDEDEVKRSLRAENVAAGVIAEVLADAKAARVAGRHPGRMVLGADQMLECEGAHYDKPGTRAEAAAQLKALRGRRHALVSQAVVWRDGERLWQASDTALMEMRDVSDAFIEAYLDAAGDAILNGPGAYRVESLGVQLFRRIGGDHFTILGLPLLPLLDFLRENRILMT